MAVGNSGVTHATEVGVERPVGVGLVAGSSPGLTIKIWTRPTKAIGSIRAANETASTPTIFGSQATERVTI
jgi:hypothetical protein